MSFYEAHIYKNIMELIVADEIKRQVSHHPGYRTLSLNLTEVSAYALNRLPPLYASSQEGLYRQKQRGIKEFKQQVEMAVRRALQIVSQKPLRLTTPLLPEEELEAEAQLARMALENLPMDEIFGQEVPFSLEVN